MRLVVAVGLLFENRPSGTAVAAAHFYSGSQKRLRASLDNEIVRRAREPVSHLTLEAIAEARHLALNRYGIWGARTTVSVLSASTASFAPSPVSEHDAPRCAARLVW